MCSEIHIFNVGRQARATRGVYTVKPEKLALCESYKMATVAAVDRPLHEMTRS